MTWCLFLYLYVDERTNERMKGRRGRGCWLVCGFVGGWLLGRRKSAKSVFKKSELAACCRSDSGLLKNNADSRRPRISSPPAEAEPDSIPFRGWCFQREKMSFDDRLWVSALRWTTARLSLRLFAGRVWASALRWMLEGM